MKLKPNVIIIVTDDQGYGDIHVNGNPWLHTPNFDWMGRHSIRLEDFHTDPLCAPARSALMSGRYSFGAGVYSTINGRYYMKPELKTMADCFKEGGYATGMFGKWHLGDTYPYCPENRGFDTVVSFGGGVIGETPDYWNNQYFDDAYLVNGIEKPFEGYCTDVWFKLAEQFIDSSISSEQPFFCYIPTNAPHGPLNVEPVYYKKYIDMGIPEKRARFYGMIECVDKNIGKLISHLKEKEVYEDTIIIYFGDNGTADGCVMDENGRLLEGYNAGMRGKKGMAYEGAHRNACFITTPGNLLGVPREVHGITAQMDILPTLAEICGLLPPGQIDGISLYQALAKGEDHINQDRVLVIHNMQRDMPQKYKDYTVLKNNMRLVCPLTNETNPYLLGAFESGKDAVPEIYDIKKDPYEEHNCYEEHIPLAIELTRYYEEWYDERLEEAMRYSPIYLTKGHPVKLTCHAWHECTKMCFSQTSIRKGIEANGFFAVEVVEEGTYEFELRRYPRESGLALGDTCGKLPKNERIFEECAEGKAYAIVGADIRIAGIKKEAKADAAWACVTFRLKLPKGATHLRTRFFMDDGRSIGAYYVYVRGVEDTWEED